MTPELQIINHLLEILIITGFVTGWFLSGAVFSTLEFIHKIWRLYRFKARKKKIAERVSTRDSGY
ncbi:hypothetical protein [Acinetobacter tianfuensis]|uniref:Uncharacterized protein n=1 Tax=Acinetobacter tianfuensis TaxID=2419603 RepID=A0A3A8E688_9GAMM|nr:hypothetical protein [Acinetobacter tianfuensis]RKG29116.1 hypothetical protein D7V32_16470 [Acinetobacter tianfuensis]